MSTIFYKEIRTFFCSVTAYCILSFFVAFIWVLLWILPGANLLDDGYSSLQKFFSFCPYIFLVLIPAITMHSFADERKAGTLDLLSSMPISRVSVFWGKYFACLSIAGIMLLLSTVNYFIVARLSMPIGNIDTAAVLGSYFGLLLLAMLFTSLGMLAAVASSKQVVALIMGIALCFVLYEGFSSLSAIASWTRYSLHIAQFGIRYHYEELSRGIIDSRNLVYFACMFYGVNYGAIRMLNRL